MVNNEEQKLINDANKELIVVRKYLDELKKEKPEKVSAEDYNCWNFCYYEAKSLVYMIKFYIDLINMNSEEMKLDK